METVKSNLLEIGEISILWRLLEKIKSKLLEIGEITVLPCPFSGISVVLVSFLVNQYPAKKTYTWWITIYLGKWQDTKQRAQKKKRTDHGHVWELMETDDLKISHDVGRF